MTLFAAIATLALSQSVGAQPMSPASSPGPSQQVPSVTVTARRPIVVTGRQACPEPQPDRYQATSDPEVVDSFPRQGAAAPPGLTQVRVTFDAPMSCYAEVTSEGGDRDPCESEGAWSLPDRRSFLLQCHLQPGISYTFKFHRDEGRGFVGMSGRDAKPFVLRFDATTADPVTTWAQAQAADPGPPGATAPRGYVTCADVKDSEASDDCRRQGFIKPASPP